MVQGGWPPAIGGLRVLPRARAAMLGRRGASVASHVEGAHASAPGAHTDALGASVGIAARVCVTPRHDRAIKLPGWLRPPVRAGRCASTDATRERIGPGLAASAPLAHDAPLGLAVACLGDTDVSSSSVSDTEQPPSYGGGITSL